MPPSRLNSLGAALAFLVLVLPAPARPQQAADTARYDVLIVGGSVIDGSGAARFAADVAIRGDRI
ncbi:MAG: hypothetical protein ACT4R6_12770, partial [Gemmatimonadaceae bacterium]